MSSVATVEFKAVGQQQVVTAFKSVGDSAATSTTKINQNSTAMKTVGNNMKSSVSSIGQVTTAFATLSLSIVNTWRSYRDLHDQQLDIDKMNTKIAKAEQSLKLDRDKLNAATKAASKGGLEYKGHQLDIAVATKKLQEQQKKYGKGSLEAAVAQQKLNEVVAAGSKGTKEMTDLEAKITLKEEALANMKGTLTQKQKSYNDTIQDFYLSIAPLAISTIATLTTAFSGLKGALTGGGGLAGLGPIGLILGGITLAIIAFKTNFLGLRDAVGGVIKWLQERFGAWKDTIQEVFGFIQKGDWNGAFNRIKEAAAAFWADLVKTVPFFGGVEVLAKQLSKGDWAGAFKTIRDAAVFFWTELKKAIPLFGTIETVIKQITAGKWEAAFKTIGDSIMKGLAAIGGDKWVLKFQLMRDTAVRAMNDLNTELTKKGGAFDLINQGFAKLGSGDIVGGLSGIGAGIKTALDDISSTINAWVLLNFGVNLTSIETQANAIGVKILDGIKSGLTFIARTWIDPIVVALLDPATWTAAFTALSGAIVSIGTAIFNAIAGAIQGAAKDPKGAATWWSQIGQAIWDGITGWFSINLPEAKVAIEAIVASFTTSINAASVDFQNMGITLWNNIVDGVKFGIEATRKNPAADFLFLFNQQAKDAFNSPEWKNLGHVAMITPEVNTKPMVDNTKKATTTITNMKPAIQVGANTKRALEISKQTTQSINNMHATIQVTARANVGSLRGFSAGAHFQHGTNTTVKRPTMFMAGEGGRPEDVYVKPRGSAGLGPGGGGSGGFNGTINIYLDGDRIDQAMRYRVTKFQGAIK